MSDTSILSVDLDWIQHWSQERQVLDICLKTFKTTNKIIFLKSHHHILNYIELDKKYSIDNIDHHNDINYDKDGYSNNWFREGNWVYFLLTRKILTEYNWIHNHNSIYGSQQSELMRDITKYNFTTDINTLNGKSYDCVVVVESFDYQQTSNFYEQLKMVANEYHKDKTIIDKTDNVTSHIWKE